jgi:mRNA-degrading endonuclease HigB of HigAB toxin-antitoxin module
MRIIARKKLVEYWTENPRTEEALKAWYALHSIPWYPR